MGRAAKRIRSEKRIESFVVHDYEHDDLIDTFMELILKHIGLPPEFVFEEDNKTRGLSSAG